jgi:NAD(P)-dependent dehydrogenase (short-subunit alcohol dehydrogenase family)
VTSLDLTGKVAVVTGASRGIGQAVALRLAAAGAQLVLTARSEAALEETAATLLAAGQKVERVATPDGAPDRVVRAAVDAFGGIDILINNAGTTKSGDFVSLTDEDWMEGYRVKLFGAARLCKAAWPELKRRGGSVVNIGGVGGRAPDERFTIGGSVNAAVMAFTKALAQLGINDGVQVNCVNPGLIRTDRLKRRIREGAERLSISAGESEARLLAENRIARFGEPQEIAELIAYIVSPRGRLLQGALIDADAGFNKAL